MLHLQATSTPSPLQHPQPLLQAVVNPILLQACTALEIPTRAIPARDRPQTLVAFCHQDISGLNSNSSSNNNSCLSSRPMLIPVSQPRAPSAAPAAVVPARGSRCSHRRSAWLRHHPHRQEHSLVPAEARLWPTGLSNTSLTAMVASPPPLPARRRSGTRKRADLHRESSTAATPPPCLIVLGPSALLQTLTLLFLFLLLHPPSHPPIVPEAAPQQPPRC